MKEQDQESQVQNRKHQLRRGPVSMRGGIKGVMTLLLVTLAAITVPQQVQAITWVSIVDDTYFTASVYYTIFYNFIEGIQWSKLENAAECRSDISALFDEFYMLNKLHHTEALTTAGMETRFFNVSNIISGPYQLSLKHCTLFMGKLQEKYADQKDEFLDLTDLYTSFLLNLLSVSYDVRKDLALAVQYYDAESYGDYAKTLGQIFRSLTTFDSLATGPLFDQEHSIDAEIEDFYDEPVDAEIFSKYGKNGYLDNDSGIYYEQDAELGPLMDASKITGPRPGMRTVKAEEEDEWAYEITLYTPFEVLFGFIEGALNTLPTGDNLYKCGTEAYAGRTHVKNVVKSVESRNFNNAVADGSSAIAVVNTTMYYCYYGGKETFTGDYFTNLIQNYSFVQNLLFNAGYMWTDIVMLTLATPATTEEDYAYFMAFYVGDFLFRIIFKATSDGNCWYPWNTCT